MSTIDTPPDTWLPLDEPKEKISPALLTIDEAGLYLAMPASTLYTWRTRRPGFGPRAVKIGGSLRYRLSDLDEWIEAHVETHGGAATNADSARGKTPSSGVGSSLTRRRTRR